jgi:hypothetical protein
MSKSSGKSRKKTSLLSEKMQSKGNKKTTAKALRKAAKAKDISAVARARKLDPAFEEKTSLDTVYLVNGTDTAVTLEIILGAPGQTGTTDIILDKVNIITAANGSLPEFALGTNRKLNASIMQITTVISDTAKDTNYLESVIRLRGGLRFSEYALFKTVEKEGGFAIYLELIFFKPDCFENCIFLASDHIDGYCVVTKH